MGFLINQHCLFVSLWFEPFWTFRPFITLERRHKSLVGPNEMNWEPCKRQARRPGPFAVHVLCHQFLPWTGAGISEDEFAPWLHGWHGSFSTLDLHSTSPDVFGGLIVCVGKTRGLLYRWTGSRQLFIEPAMCKTQCFDVWNPTIRDTSSV